MNAPDPMTTPSLPDALFAFARAAEDLRAELPHVTAVVQRHVRGVKPALSRTAAALRGLTPLIEQLHMAASQDADLAGHLQRLGDVLVANPLSENPSDLSEATQAITVALADSELQAWFLARGTEERTAYLCGCFVGPLEAGVRWNVRTIVGLSAFLSELLSLPEASLEHVRALAYLDGAELDRTKREEAVKHLEALCEAFHAPATLAASSETSESAVVPFSLDATEHPMHPVEDAPSEDSVPVVVHEVSEPDPPLAPVTPPDEQEQSAPPPAATIEESASGMGGLRLSLHRPAS